LGVTVLQRSKHLEEVMAKIEHNEIGPQLFREFMGLVIPGSGVIMGDFRSLKAVDKWMRSAY
jgi:hypothetical protein